MKTQQCLDPLTDARFNLFAEPDRHFLASFLERHPRVGDNFSRFLNVPPPMRPDVAKSDLWHTPRAGWVKRAIPNPEDIDSHAVNLKFMSQAALISSFATEHYDDDFIRHVSAMARLHDFCEAIATDFTPHDKITPQDKDRIESLALQVLFEDARFAHGKALIQEYIDQQTPASHILHDLDKLHAVFMAYGYEQAHPEKSGIYNEFKTYAATQLKTPLGHAIDDGLAQDAATCISEILGLAEQLKSRFIRNRMADVTELKAQAGGFAELFASQADQPAR